MKTLYCALAACTIVALMAAPASALDVKAFGGQSENSSRAAFSCDEGAQDNAFYQNQGSFFGNAFDVGAGGPLSQVDFEHFGFGFAGPYDYNLVVLDEATCTVVGTVNGLSAQDAGTTAAQEIVDTCDEDIQVSGNTVVTVEPLTCLAANDCYPDLFFDSTGVVNSCGRIVAGGAGCDTPAQSATGPLDFLLRITVDECEPTPTESVSWSHMKNTYR